MRLSWLAAFVVTVLVPATTAHVAGQNRLRHDAGQSVTPSFEGWYQNVDGTFSLLFGYFNRNFQEALDIPVGSANTFEPGPADQGQPTHFLPQRQAGVFVVKVPRDFGNQKLTWTLTSHGQTISIPGSLRPDFKIEAFKMPATGEVPPKLRFDPTGSAAEGPEGLTTATRIGAGEGATLNVWVPTVQSVPASGRGGVPPFRWSQYRGAGEVTFSNQTPTPDASGKTTTTATFSEAGEYVLRFLAGRATTDGCCWTNAFVKVTVVPAASPRR